MPHDGACNQWWISLILDALAAHGCEDVVICPGNRDLPLMIGLLADQRFSCYSHLDERSAAFRALGICRSRKQPAAVVTTSGSAVANCLPALCEAHATGDPVILLSADRPPHLQGSGAPQTMPQDGIFTSFCAASCDLGLPQQDAAGDMLNQLVDSLEIGLTTPGPIHVNIPFDEPLLGDDLDPALPKPLLTRQQRRSQLDAPLYEKTLTLLREARQGILVIGSKNPLPFEVLEAFAAQGWPIMCDATDNLRWSGLGTLISSADLLCGLGKKLPRPDVIVRAGPAPLARPVWEWLQQQDCPIIRFDHQEIRKDFCHGSFVFPGKVASFNEAAYHKIQHSIAHQSVEWTAHWLGHENKAADFLLNWVRNTDDFNEVSAVGRICHHDSNQQLYLQTANSLSVRHGNLFCSPRYPWKGVWTSRGVNGIDGTVGTAIGLSQYAGPMRLLCGDLALIHDAAALPALAAAQLPLQIIILNNGGGRIFDTLKGTPSNNDEDPVQRFLRTPQLCDFQLLGQSCGIHVERITDFQSLEESLATPLNAPRLSEIILGDVSPAPTLQTIRSEFIAHITR